ncbi:MAG: hypothetical protein GY815_02585 [Gammaproteobacteria bacterium]|nr:hypothetical protein [Gammaproteobacteria bacterium]
MKYTVYTTAAEDYITGVDSSLVMCEPTDLPDPNWGWAKVGEVEFTPIVPESDIREAAVKELDREMHQRREDFTRGMEELQRQKEELLAITHQQKDES